MSKRAVIVSAAAVVVVLIGIVAMANTEKAPVDYGRYNMSAIANLAKAVPRNKLDIDSVLEATEESGNLPDKVIGDPSKAKVVVYEYADYACAHCAEWSRTLDKMVEKANGELAVVYRGYLLGFKNGVIAASAATAAQMQGCWQEYKKLLFANQSEWFYASGEELENELVVCFEKASGGQGDVEKFKADMASEDVAKKVAFEYRLGDEIDLTGTPTFRIDGEKIEITDLEETIKEKLARG